MERDGVQKKVMPETDIVAASPVNWERVDQVPPSPYIDYKVIVVNQRILGLFPPGLGMMNVSQLTCCTHYL